MASKKNGNGSDKKTVTAEQREADSKKSRDAHCSMYQDIRLFGAVVTSRMLGIKGACQHTLLRSLHPVNVIDDSITRCAVATEKEYEKKDRTMGSQSIVEYALVDGWTFISGSDAKRNGLTWRMLNELIDGIMSWPSHTRSGARPDVRFERLHVLVHESAFGDCPERMSRKLFGFRPMSDNPTSLNDFALLPESGDVSPMGRPNALPDTIRIVTRGVLDTVEPDVFGTVKRENVIDVPNLDAVIEQRVEIYHAYSVHMSNLQGDPAAANHPRLDTQGYCYMTIQGMRRRIRDFLEDKYKYIMFIARGSNLQEQTNKAELAVGLEPLKPTENEETEAEA